MVDSGDATCLHMLEPLVHDPPGFARRGARLGRHPAVDGRRRSKKIEAGDGGPFMAGATMGSRSPGETLMPCTGRGSLHGIAGARRKTVGRGACSGRNPFMIGRPLPADLTRPRGRLCADETTLFRKRTTTPRPGFFPQSTPWVSSLPRPASRQSPGAWLRSAAAQRTFVSRGRRLSHFTDGPSRMDAQYDRSTPPQLERRRRIDAAPVSRRTPVRGRCRASGSGPAAPGPQRSRRFSRTGRSGPR